ncbi:uncharacterized protein METZ01_LOCUS334582, partial [marine metagenome]
MARLIAVPVSMPTKHECKIKRQESFMKPINVGIIGTGWTGGIRANACSKTPLIDELHIA